MTCPKCQGEAEVKRAYEVAGETATVLISIECPICKTGFSVYVDVDFKNCHAFPLA